MSSPRNWGHNPSTASIIRSLCRLAATWAVGRKDPARLDRLAADLAYRALSYGRVDPHR
jgi:hypothetical protein